MKELTLLVSGVQGQDGGFLARKLLARGYKVVGVSPWKSSGVYESTKDFFSHPNFIYVSGDLVEKEFIDEVFRKYKPDWVFHMGAISLVSESFKIPVRVMNVNTMSVVNILETIRYNYPKTKFYFAGSSEQIGKNKEIPQNHNSKMIPQSPYAISKLASYHFVRLYREAYGLFAVNGMLFNHESVYRPEMFVTRKISKSVAMIKNGKINSFSLGNLDSQRDWGHAPEYVDAMIMMMERDVPDDYTIATGETHSVREFVEIAFSHIGETITWEGEGVSEVGKNQHGEIRVTINKDMYRPAEVDILYGDYSHAEKTLGWKPKTKFRELVKIMVDEDIKNNG
jgi:GDPmannose 4,6-dehydratase